MTHRWLVLVLAWGIVGCKNGEDPNRITATGTIEVVDVTVSSKVSGEALTIPVDEGAAVKAGDVIATIDASMLEVQLREAEAGIATAEAQLALLHRGARAEDIHQAESAVKQAQTNRDLAALDLERARSLHNQEAGTRQQVDNAEARYRVAQLQVEQASENAQKLRSFVRPEEIAAAESRIAQLAASRDRVQKLISDCTIRSPINGMVTHKLVQQGELVGQGGSIATITDLSRVDLMLYIPEPELPRIKLGQRVEVRVDGTPAKIHNGTVAYISPQAEFTPKNVQTKDDRVKLVFAVKVTIDNPSGELKPGLPADAAIVVN